MTFAQWKNIGFDTQTTTDNPLWNADFSLLANSPALALGISSIRTNGIGCYNNPLRASWPIWGSGTLASRTGSRRCRSKQIEPAMKAIILCGGQGTRLRDYTEVLPKPMVEIGGRPIHFRASGTGDRARLMS